MKPDPRIIVGISCSHDASACLLVEGKLVLAVQLERLTRVKHDGRPFLSSRQAVDYCLDAAGLTPDDVDLFAFNSQNLLPGQVGLGFPLADGGFDLFDPLGERSVFVTHHLAHAFAAYFCAPFGDATVMVIDGSGGSVVGDDDLILDGPGLAAYIDRPVPVPRPGYHAESVYHFTDSGYRLCRRHVARSFHPMCGSSSLGETYAAVSQYVFGDWMEGGKLMGLAPYGQAEAFGPSLLERAADGLPHFTSGWKAAQTDAVRRQEPMAHRHLAARVQRDLETGLVARARHAIGLTGAARLAYAGGVALNSVANQRIVELPEVERFYVMPASHDAGICIGAAAAALYFATGRCKGQPVGHDFLGRGYRPDEVASAIAAHQGALAVETMSIQAVARRLRDGEVVGWFEGGAEFGPRALGHRSILAAPFERETWRHLNAAIKYREEFRPYAPLVLAEAAETYFDMGPDPESPYMLRVVRVKDEWRPRLGAVTHADGSARVQTVDHRRTPRLHALLTAFAALTGVPVLVNTSMNVRGQPMVETPSQAVEMLLSTGMDCLVMEDRLLTRYGCPADRIGDHAVILAPGCALHAEGRGDGIVCTVTSQAQGNRPVEVPGPLFLCLADAAAGRTVDALLAAHGIEGPRRAEALAILRDLIAGHRLLLVRPPASSPAPPAPERADDHAT